MNDNKKVIFYTVINYQFPYHKGYLGFFPSESLRDQFLLALQQDPNNGHDSKYFEADELSKEDLEKYLQNYKPFL